MKKLICFLTVLFLTSGMLNSQEKSAERFSMKRLDAITVKNLDVRNVSAPALASLLQSKLKEWDQSGQGGIIIVPPSMQNKKISFKADSVSMKKMLQDLCNANDMFFWIENDGRLVMAQKGWQPPRDLTAKIPDIAIAVPDEELMSILAESRPGEIQFMELPFNDALKELKAKILAIKYFQRPDFELLNISSKEVSITFAGSNQSGKDAIINLCRSAGLRSWVDGNIIIIAAPEKKKPESKK